MKPLCSRVVARCRADDDDGSIVSFLIVFVAAFAVLLLVIQVGIFAYTSHVAATAARQAAQRAAAEDISAGEGAAYADSFVENAAGGWLVDKQVGVSVSGSNVVATVSGDVFIVVPIPGFELSVEREAISKVERFYNSTEVAG